MWLTGTTGYWVREALADCQPWRNELEFSRHVGGGEERPIASLLAEMTGVDR